jgi:hypothetical protein
MRWRVNWRSKRQVLIVILVAVAVVMIAGASAAWINRNQTTCADGKPPVAQRGGILGQALLRCHNGQIVTTPG